MKSKLLVLIAIVSAFLAIGCTTTDSGESETSENATSAQSDAAALYTQITEEDTYKEWELMPGTSEMDPGTGPHGDMITVYVSDDAFSAIGGNAEVMPNGSILLKEGYSSEGELEQIVLMQKIDGYDPEHNDWFWAAYSPDGEVLSEGSLSTCYDCHSQVQDNDYIFTGSLNETA
ncbi:MAG: cytochrome P460 family protein [Methanolobus sp.]|nr:cytochrome P460 family protein [Methanolobus sp.]